MAFRKFKFALPLLFVLSLLLSSFSTVKNDNPKDKILLTILRYVLTEGHYHPQQINDSFSESVYFDFLKRIDPSKRYFLQSDIDEFAQYKFSIDDQIKSEDLTFFYLVHNRLQARTEETKEYYKAILASKLNFDKDETVDIEYDNNKFAGSKNGIIDIWRKQLKLSVLSRLHDKINDENDKLKEDSTYVKKTYEVLEKEARESTLKNMNELYQRIDELTYEDWFSTYINAITEKFDPHTSYFDPKSKKGFEQRMSGKLEGIGARLQKSNDYTKVSELVFGGPAWKQGELEVGDLILKVGQGDEEPIDIVGMRLDNAIEFIKGKKGTTVKLTIKKVDGTLKEIAIVRDVVELEETFLKSTVVNKNGKKFGVINLPSFYEDFDEKNFRNAATDMEKEIERLKKEGVEGLVVDLRFNGGGSLKSAIEITGLFINKGPVVQVKYRGRDPQVKNDKNPKIQWDGPLVVLVNEFSASASEIFSAAMQDYQRAVIIGGKHTYGKGTVQTVMDLNRYHNLKDDIGALKITIQKYYRINGNSPQLDGVTPDVKLPSRYSYMDIGEKDLENALKSDKVAPANYTIWNKYENFNQVINNSKKRISNSAYFKLAENNAKWLKKSQDDTVIPLNLTAYEKDLENNKNATIKFKKLNDYQSDLTYTSPLYEQELVKNNSDLLEKREAWHKNLKKDSYLEEALNVLSELKIKPEYLLVKK